MIAIINFLSVIQDPKYNYWQQKTLMVNLAICHKFAIAFKLFTNCL